MRRAGALPLMTAATALTSGVVLGPWQRLMDEPQGLYGQMLVGVALIAAAGAVLRLTPLAWFAVLSAQLLVALLVVNAYWGSSTWPTPTSVRTALGAMGHAIDSAGRFDAPIGSGAPTIAPLLLVGALAVHLVVDLVAVTLGRVALAGLPLLMAYTVPVSVLGRPTSWVAFALGGACFLAMLGTDERGRLDHWGRRLRTGEKPRGAVLLGGSALATALLASTLMPSNTTLFRGFGPGSGGPVRITDPIADLKRDLVLGPDLPLLQIKVTAGPSIPAPSYVRLTVLDDFDGESWRPAAHRRLPEQTATGTMPLVDFAPGQAGADVDWQVNITENLASEWLPVPRYLRSIEAGPEWRYSEKTLDFRAVGDDVTTAGLSYPLTEFRPQLTADELAAGGEAPDEIREEFTSLPEVETFRALARRETAGATSDYARGVALQRFFQSNFTYSTRTAPGNGVDALEKFLSPSGREGYCEQFAAAMAVLARSLGIPARVSVGFLSGERTTPGTFEFSSHDLHAWPELYISGAGWVMFEPTPTSHTRSLPGYTQPSAGPSTSASASPSASAAQPSTSKAPRPERPEPGAAGQSGASDVLSTWLPAVGLLVGVLLLLGLLPRAVRRRRRVRRLAAATPEEMWAELRDTAVDLGVPWPAGKSPRVTGRALAGAVKTLPDAPVALRRVVAALEMERYAPAAERTAAADQLVIDVETCLDALRDGSESGAQRRAAWWPRSLLQRATRDRTLGRRDLAPGSVDRLDDQSS